MNRTMHVKTPPPRRAPLLDRNQLGYAATLSARVAELRSRLHAEFTSKINTSSEQRQARLDALMSELHARMASESCLRAQLELARAAQRQRECAERRTGLEQTLAESAEIRQCLTRAGQSMRHASALLREERRTELRQEVGALLADAQEQSNRFATEFVASAQQARAHRREFMETMREQVAAMADAFRADHEARCHQSAQSRMGVLAAIHEFVDTLTGRFAQPAEPPAATPPQMSSAKPAAEPTSAATSPTERGDSAASA